MTASAAGSVEEPGRNVKAKSGLNRRILDQGWSLFADMLGYKLPERGGERRFVNPAYTSQCCSECGGSRCGNSPVAIGVCLHGLRVCGQRRRCGRTQHTTGQDVGR
jgi:putative transposase